MITFLIPQREASLRFLPWKLSGEDNLFGPGFSLTLRPDIINKGEREQHLEAMHPAGPSLGKRKKRAFFYDPAEQAHQDEKQPEIVDHIPMKDLFVLLSVNARIVDLPVEPVQASELLCCLQFDGRSGPDELVIFRNGKGIEPEFSADF